MFKNSNEFSLHIEKIKEDQNCATYIEAMTFFYENETDHEFDDIVKLLNKKIIGEIEVEAENAGLLKQSGTIRLC